jgi:outer membrane immunogenic protein
MPRLAMKATLLGGAALLVLTVSAFAADIGVPGAAISSPPPLPFTWTSCYGGLRAGGGLGQSNLTDTAGVVSATSGFTSANLNISGYMVGGQIGCDYQFAPNWVVGIEAAASGGNIGATTTIAVPLVPPGDTATYKETTDFLMSATARVGYAWDRWMLYAKGGVAGANNKYSAFDTASTYNFQGLDDRIGWTVGAGVEWALWQDWSIRLEYDYYGFGTRSVTFNDATFTGVIGPESINQNIQVVTLSINFHAYAGP